MLLCIVYIADIVIIKLTTAVNINLIECLINEAESCLVHVSLHSAEELIVVDGAVMISVEGLEETSDIYI